MFAEPNTESKRPEEKIPPWLEIVRQQVASVRFGHVQITVHDGHVTQIESTHRFRLTPSSSPDAVRRDSSGVLEFR